MQIKNLNTRFNEDYRQALIDYVLKIINDYKIHDVPKILWEDSDAVKQILGRERIVDTSSPSFWN